MDKQSVMEACFDLIFMEEVQYRNWSKNNPDGDQQLYERNIRALGKSIRKQMQEYGKTRHCDSLRCKDERCQ